MYKIAENKQHFKRVLFACPNIAQKIKGILVEPLAELDCEVNI